LPTLNDHIVLIAAPHGIEPINAKLESSRACTSCAFGFFSATVEPPLPPTASSMPDSPPPSHSMVTRARSGNLKPKSFFDYTVFYSTKHPLRALSTVVQSVELNSYNQVVSKPEWRASIRLSLMLLMSAKYCIFKPP
jgi:hypothetical protein